MTLEPPEPGVTDRLSSDGLASYASSTRHTLSSMNALVEDRWSADPDELADAALEAPRCTCPVPLIDTLDDFPDCERCADAAIARKFERFLQRETPGRSWRLRERGEPGRLLKAAPGEVDIGPGRPDDQGEVAA